jgi:hypothetical protein
VTADLTSRADAPACWSASAASGRGQPRRIAVHHDVDALVALLV